MRSRSDGHSAKLKWLRKNFLLVTRWKYYFCTSSLHWKIGQQLLRVSPYIAWVVMKLPMLEDIAQRISPSCVGRGLIAMLFISSWLVGLFHLTAIPLWPKVTRGWWEQIWGWCVFPGANICFFACFLQDLMLWLWSQLHDTWCDIQY